MTGVKYPLLDAICRWAVENSEVHGLVLIGSQARKQLVADQWSDTDLMVFVSDPAVFLNSTDWLEEFGQVVAQYNLVAPLHFVDWDWCVKRVLYANNMDVDFSLVPYERLTEVLSVNADIIEKGYQVLYDPRPPFLQISIAELEKEKTEQSIQVLSKDALDKIVNEILYHVIWVYKKVKREELWVAVDMINGHLNHLLLLLIENFNVLSGKTSFIHYDGRFLEQRTDQEILADIEKTYSHYDATDAVVALEHILDFTQYLVKLTCKKTGFPYSQERFDQTRALFDQMTDGFPL